MDIDVQTKGPDGQLFRPASHLVETSGDAEFVNAYLASCESGSTIYQVGLFGGGVPVELNQLVFKEVAYKGILSGVNVWPELIRMVQDADIPLDRLVWNTFPLAEAYDAIRAAAQRSVHGSKVLIQIDADAV
ncbi:hypothetical protein GCM10027570_14010 [Streptomonospora sediminis]